MAFPSSLERPVNAERPLERREEETILLASQKALEESGRPATAGGAEEGSAGVYEPLRLMSIGEGDGSD